MVVFRSIMAEENWRMAGTLSYCGFLVVYMAIIKFPKKVSSKSLAWYNLIGSVSWTCFYIVTLIMGMYPPQAQANVCGFYGFFAYMYYLTEVILFINRLALFYQMDPHMIHRLKVTQSAILVCFSVIAISDAIWRDYGITLWNDQKHAAFCIAPAVGMTYALYPIGVSLMAYLFYVGYITVHTYVKEQSSRHNSTQRSRFAVLALMLTSYFLTLSSASFHIVNIMFPIPELNFRMTKALEIATPIDTFVSLVLTNAVFFKLQSEKASNTNTNAVCKGSVQAVGTTRVMANIRDMPDVTAVDIE